MEKLLLRGKIFSGLGKGAFFTQLDWVKQQCLEKLNFIPYPGTLNVNVREEYREVIEKLREEEGIILIPPSPEFCQAKCYPVSINTIRSAIVLPQAEHFTDEVHPQTVLEIIAPICIKDVLSVKDGDEITLEVEKS